RGKRLGLASKTPHRLRGLMIGSRKSRAADTMPDSKKPGTRSGPIIVTIIAVLGVAAAIGTGTRFASQNPYSLQVEALDEQSVSAQFAPKSATKIQPRMMAVLSFEGSELRWEGRVKDVQSGGEFVVVVVEFSENLPSFPPGRVSVDTSFPPEVLK
ncbi:MAG: hypothetical protein WEB60_12505, partial [Terrimicrobiaceae bacterium]